MSIFKRKKRTNYSSKPIEGNIVDYINKLVELLFESKREDVAEDVIQAYIDPCKFVNENEEMFEEFFLGEVSEEDYKGIALIVLYQYMKKEKRACSLDWCAYNEDVHYALNEMLQNKNLGKVEVLDSEDDVDERKMYVMKNTLEVNTALETEQFIKLCSEEVSKVYNVICDLGRDSDSFDLFLVPNECFSKVIEVSEFLGFKVKSIY